jgi:hypothetical protein
MRQLTNYTYVTLDGAVEAPHRWRRHHIAAVRRFCTRNVDRSPRVRLSARFVEE